MSWVRNNLNGGRLFLQSDCLSSCVIGAIEAGEVGGMKRDGGKTCQHKPQGNG